MIAKRKTVNFRVVKLWRNKEKKDLDSTDKLPKVTVHLHKDDDSSLLKSAIIGFADGWFSLFKKLPLFDGSRKINYSLIEDKVEKVDGYEDFVSDISFDETKHEFTIINHEPYPNLIGGIGDYNIIDDKDKDKDKDRDEDKAKEKDKDKIEDKASTPQDTSNNSEGNSSVIPDFSNNPSPIPSLPKVLSFEDELNENAVVVSILDGEENFEELEITTPPTPLSVGIIEEEIPELLLDGDEVPRGSTDIKDGDIQKNVKKTVGGKILAKTGGFLIRFKFIFIGLVVLICALIGTEIYRRKRNRHNE